MSGLSPLLVQIMSKSLWRAGPFMKSEASTATRYFIVGASGQFSDYAITLGVYTLIPSVAASNAIAYISASLYTYALHTIFTFRRPSSEIVRRERVLNFGASCIIGATVSTIILIVLVKTGLPLHLAKIIQLLIAAALQYLYNRLITFRAQ